MAKTKIIGKKHSKRAITNYEAHEIKDWVKTHNENFSTFDQKLERTKSLCLARLNAFLSSTPLSTHIKQQPKTQKMLSDAFIIEGMSICYFDLDTTMPLDDQKKLLEEHPQWITTAMAFHLSGKKPLDGVVLLKNQINRHTLSSLFKLQHDSLEAIAGQILWTLDGMYHKNLTPEERLQQAVEFGQLTKLYDVYLYDSPKQKERASKPRNQTATNVIAELVRLHPDDSSTDLWDKFIGELEATEEPNAKGNLSCRYYDDNGIEKHMSFGRFKNKVTDAKN
ncbi:hypothetical protein [Marinomonas fungiae]|uniref:Uncharacterized protein n=1 Tax=Marinomonas fungiae TaxID=1137284 RepID=A0A0K6IPX7_9GAMM|nr:hypothetical protein [Marinomonas fungiae]CUB05377.1 hypothetical protein Ga0061065_11082 [Marinomonas fungiae]